MNLPNNIVINTDITILDDKTKSIVGMCIRANKNTSNMLYINHSVCDFVDSSNAEYFAIKWALQVLLDRQEKGEYNSSLNIEFLCDNKTVVQVINSGKLINSNLNKMIGGELFKNLGISKTQYNNLIKFTWINRSQNELIHNYVFQQKVLFLTSKNDLGSNVLTGFDKYIRLLKLTLDNIANIRHDIVRHQHALKLINQSNSDIRLTIEDRDIIIMNKITLKIKFYAARDKHIVKSYIAYITKLDNIIENYNNKLDEINNILLKGDTLK